MMVLDFEGFRGEVAGGYPPVNPIEIPLKRHI